MTGCCVCPFGMLHFRDAKLLSNTHKAFANLAHMQTTHHLFSQSKNVRFGKLHRHDLSQRTWKTLEDVGRRCWKTWGSLAKSLGRRVFDLKKKKSFFSFFKFENHVFQAISRGFPTSSSNVFQRLPTSSICVETICGDGITKPIFLHTLRTKPYNSNATHVT